MSWVFQLIYHLLSDYLFVMFLCILHSITHRQQYMLQSVSCKVIKHEIDVT